MYPSLTELIRLGSADARGHALRRDRPARLAAPSSSLSSSTSSASGCACPRRRSSCWRRRVASDIWPGLGDALSIRDVERIAVVALIVILFDGGMRVGWSRFRESARADRLAGSAGDVRDRRADDTRRALSAGLLLADVGPARRRAGSYRSRGDVLRLRAERDRRPHRHDPRGRVGCERPGRDRAHARRGEPGPVRLDVGRARSRRVRARSSGSESSSESSALTRLLSCCGASFCRTLRSIPCARWPSPG